MLKILGILIIISTSTLLGFVFGENLKKRLGDLNELERAVNHLQNQIVYTYSPLPEAIKEVAEKSKKPINLYFEYIAEMLQNNRVNSVFEAFSKSYEKNKGIMNLNKTDLDIILTLSKTLGDSNVDGQQRMFELCLSNIKKQINDAEEKMNKSLKMYRYLGFSLGAVAVIILI